MKSVEVRSKLLETLRLDLVGPWKGAVSKEGYEYEQEVLTQAPSRWYLTGFLVPVEASPDQRYDETARDEIDELEATTAASDDRGTPEPASAPSEIRSSAITL